MLVICQECGASISSTAAGCPRCGAPRDVALTSARASRIERGSEGATSTYFARPLAPLWRPLQGILVLYAAAAAFDAGCSASVLAIIQNVGDPDLQNALALEQVSGTIRAVLELVAAVPFLNLTYRAMRNLHERGGVGATISPGWAVGWYFVPVASLWMPFLAVQQIWRGSASRVHPLDASAPIQIGLWWLLWLATNWISLAMFGLGRGLTSGPTPEPTLSVLMLVEQLDVARNLLTLPMILLAGWFWERIVAMQDAGTVEGLVSSDKTGVMRLSGWVRVWVVATLVVWGAGTVVYVATGRAVPPTFMSSYDACIRYAPGFMLVNPGASESDWVDEFEIGQAPSIRREMACIARHERDEVRWSAELAGWEQFSRDMGGYWPVWLAPLAIGFALFGTLWIRSGFRRES